MTDAAQIIEALTADMAQVTSRIQAIYSAADPILFLAVEPMLLQAVQLERQLNSLLVAVETQEAMV